MVDVEVRALVERGETIAAVRLYHERHGGTLIDARAAIEAVRWSITQLRGGALGELERELDEMLRRGDRLAAIRRYREATGSSLKAATEAIAGRATPQAAAEARPDGAVVDAGLQPALDRLIREGRKLEAVKLLRERTGLTLRGCKEVIDARVASLGPG